MSKAKKRISSIGTVGAFINGRACSDTLCHVLNRAFHVPMELEEKAVAPLAGGIKQYGYQCGMLWGATLAAGAEAYRRYGAGPRAEAAAVRVAQRLVESFRDRNNTINCLEITDIDRNSSVMKMVTYFLVKGGTIGCFRRAAQYAPVAYKEINAVFSETPEEEGSCNPASCAAMLAKKMGLSDKHVVMAAGLAGGIGFSGGACGALGAAVWIMGMKVIQERGVDNLWSDKEYNKRLTDLIDRFLKKSDYTFECEEIVGRKFENVEDHSQHLRAGGCAKIIDELAKAYTSEGPEMIPLHDGTDTTIHDDKSSGRKAA